MKKILLLLPLPFLFTLAACAHKDKYAWVNDLPVKAQSSQENAQRQDIHLQEVLETKPAKGTLWLRGPGFAEVNDVRTPYFWQKRELPTMEITIMEPESEAFKQCLILFDQMPSKRMAVRLMGDGMFMGRGDADDGFVGVFRMDRVKQCVLLPKGV